MTAAARLPAAGLRAVRGAFAGVTAIGVKELRGRMRGRRAFVVLTIYLTMLATFALMMALILERQYSNVLGGSAAYGTVQIGRGVFAALLVLQTILVIVLAPAFTAASISQEREKQTLDMLATTPISSLALVIGKLVSALTYVFILIVASVPLTAIVFVFGGVEAGDLVRGYVVLLATAFGLGAVGLFFSALFQRTQAALIATYGALAVVTAGAFFLAYFWNAMTGASEAGAGARQFGPLSGRPPAALQYLNPYFAQADILCTVEDNFGEWCNRAAFAGIRSTGLDVVEPPKIDPGFPVNPGVGVNPGFGGAEGRDASGVLPGADGDPDVIEPVPNSEVIVGDGAIVVPIASRSGAFWPNTVVAWLGLALVLIVASVQLVSPTRRWRPFVALPGRLGRPSRRSAP